MPKKTKPQDSDVPVEEEKEAKDALSGLVEELQQQEENRTILLYGEIEEEKAADICAGLLYLMKKTPDPEKAIQFYISTYGGNADDMFAIYDMMNIAKKSCTIETVGLGKVMSAGVLLLANGTPGSRKVAKNCRVMSHSCTAGSAGDIHNLKNEMEAIQYQQDQYINALVQASSLTKRQLTRLLDRKVNVYLTAEEAIEYGIADEIM